MTLADLFPPSAFLALRSTLESVRRIHPEEGGEKADRITGYTLPVLGTLPALCHRSVADPRADDFRSLCGAPLPGRIEVYDDEADYLGKVRARLERGGRAAMLFDLPPPLDADPRLLVPQRLSFWLNDKANIDRIVPGEFRPRFRLEPIDRLPGLAATAPGAPVYVKACHPGYSGGGGDVRFCGSPADWEAILAWLQARRDELSAVLIEDAVEVVDCWAVGLGVLDDSVVFAGAAEPIFITPAVQVGSQVDSRRPVPASVRDAALLVAGRARQLGFRGAMGMDVGVRPDGSPCIFDLNFRMTLSLPLVLAHAPLSRRTGKAMTSFARFASTLPLAQALERLMPIAESGLVFPFTLAPMGEGCELRLGLAADTAGEAAALARRIADSVGST